MTHRHPTTKEEVLIHRATGPGEEDEYQILDWCEECQEGFAPEEE